MNHAVTLTRNGNCGLITIASPPVNALGQAVRSGLVETLAAALEDPQVAWVLLKSAGRGFSAGADIKEFGQTPQAPLLPEVIEAIESSPKPVVAWLHGMALGGGLELAMACQYRVAQLGTRLGLPEVTLGLIPGAGGTQRLPRLVGLEAALEMMLSGDPVETDRALALGLIDRAAPEATPEGDRQRLGEALAAGGTRRTRDLPIQAEAADPHAWLTQRRHALPASEAEAPAPVRVIEALEAALREPFEAALARERELFVACRDSPQRRAKVEAFLARKHNRTRPNGARHDDSRGSTA